MNVGICLNERDGRQCRINSVLFADDAALIADVKSVCNGLRMKWQWCVCNALCVMYTSYIYFTIF